MKTNHFIKVAALLLVCCVMLGCEKQNVEPEPEIVTKIYGTVFDARTGAPVQGAWVKFMLDKSTDGKETISSSVSGTDGQYEISFGKLPKLTYSFYKYAISVTCDGYYSEFTHISIVEGNSHCIDFNLTK